MSRRADCVVFAETTLTMVQLRNTYAQCGQILSISPWEPRADRVHMTCFIEFADEEAVRRARARYVKGTKLHVVSQSPQLIAHFLSIVQPARSLPLHSMTPSSSRLALHAVEVKQEPREDWHLLKRVSESEATQSNESSPRKKARRSDKSADIKPSVPGDTLTASSPDPCIPRASARSPLSTQTAFNGQVSNKENCADYHGSVSTSVSKRMRPLPRRGDTVLLSPKRTAVNVPDASAKALGGIQSAFVTQQPESQPLQESAIQDMLHSDGPQAPSDVPALSPIITLTYHGQPVTCDLRKLEDDPAKIIAVLKAIASCALERDKWMIVAVQYRVKGLFMSAIGVLEAMIEVMTSPPVSLSKSDIKPAYLMLSSCHRDIAARGGSVDAAFHVRQATEYLQQVYGADIPRAQVTSEFAEARARSCMDLPHLLASSSNPESGTPPARECLVDAGNSPAVRAAREHPPNQGAPEASASSTDLGRMHSRHADVSTHNGGTHRERSQYGSGTRTDSHSRSTTSSSEQIKQIQILEREIQSLRDRAAEQAAVLLSVRRDKRQLEDELVTQHAAYRRLNRDAETTSNELSRAREELARAKEDAARLKDELGHVRRGEEGALEQAAAEVASRRAAEGRVEVLREEMGRLQNEMGRLKADWREEEREADRRARETFAKLGALFTKAGRGELPIGLGLDGDGFGGDVRRVPATPREDARSRSASTSGRGWGSVSVSGAEAERSRRSSGGFERPL